MAVKYLSGNRLWGTNAERTGMTTEGSPSQTSWKELDRATLDGSSADVDVTGLTAKDNLMILVYSIGSNTNDAFISFNGDEGGNYALAYSRDGTEQTPDTSQGIGLRLDQGSTTPQFAVITIKNIASLEKLVVGHTITQSTAGAGNAPNRQEWTGKWANTSDAIPQVTLNRASGDFEDGTELVVLGCDDDEADSGTNFWQELGKAEQTTDARTIDTGAITAKKYLWVESSYKYTSGNDPFLQFNSDHDSNYIYRRSMAGGSDTTSGANGGAVDNANTDYNFYDTNFIVNISDKEKLVICHTAHDVANTGADNAPARREFAGKWAEDGEQITSVQYYLDSTGNMQGYIKVWGSD